VVQFNAAVSPPQTYDGAHASTDAVVSFVVAGDSAADVERILKSCVQWSNLALLWTTP
jgi:hypothetical protein